MALYAELALYAFLGETTVTIQLDDVRGGLHDELWRHSITMDLGPDNDPATARTWLCAALEVLTAHLRGELVVDQNGGLAAADDTFELPAYTDDDEQLPAAAAADDVLPFWKDADGQYHE
jgi:hypothetical protein